MPRERRDNFREYTVTHKRAFTKKYANKSFGNLPEEEQKRLRRDLGVNFQGDEGDRVILGVKKKDARKRGPNGGRVWSVQRVDYRRKEEDRRRIKAETVAKRRKREKEEEAKRKARSAERARKEQEKRRKAKEKARKAEAKRLQKAQKEAEKRRKAMEKKRK